MSDDARPNPKRGRLTVFFGAAPGVGKTFAMLEAARQEREQGRDVVVGVAESHGQKDTVALLTGLEALAPSALDELDLDAVLARRPALVVIDELAHRNAPGSRHPRRWQDVDELVDAGIDVYTTLDVRHLESLVDVVAQITGVVVRETVPDAVLEGAHEVRLVDLPPDELLERVREGKIDVSEEKASFFRKGNLIALRELALRHTAQRVDAEMHAYRRDQGIDGPWAVTERILVAVSWSPYSARLVRAACRMARGLRAPWIAVYVDTPASLGLSARDRAQLAQNLRLAEELGAEIVTLEGVRAVDAVIRYARSRNVTRFVVGKPGMIRLRDRLFGSFVDELVRKSGGIDVHVTTGAGEGDAANPAEGAARAPRASRFGWGGYAATFAMLAAATAVNAALFGRAQPTNVVMVYLLGVVLVAMRFGYAASVLASIGAVLAFDFFFVPPYFTFAVSDVRHVFTFGVMLTVALIISSLAQRVRAQAAAAEGRERRTSVLYAMTRELSREAGRDALTSAAARHLGAFFESEVVVYAPDARGALEVVHRERDERGGAADEAAQEDAVVRWVWDHGREAGATTGTLAGARGLYVPLTGPHGPCGVLGLSPRDPERFADPDQRRLLEAFAAQVAVALDRAKLADETQRARVEAEREHLLNALLSSVSHDLRTPLATITGAASVLLDDSVPRDDRVRRELLESIYEEGQRLNRLVRNLLEMTRLESGSVEVKKELQPLEEVIGAALNRLDARLEGRDVRVRLPVDLPLVPIDAVLMEQVFLNLVENALRYTPPASPIEISARAGEAEVIVEVADRGPGVAAADVERIFEKFQRGGGRREPGGVGLGLAICRGVVRAHGGRIRVENRAGGGASFELALPAPSEPARAARSAEVEATEATEEEVRS